MIYYVLTLTSGLLLFSKEFKENEDFRARVLVFTSNWICFLISFRSYFVGTDSAAYTSFYSYIANYNGSPFDLANNVYLFSKNKGWTIFFWVISRVVKNPNAYLFVSGLFISTIFLYVIFKSKLDIRYQLMIYILLLYLPSFNATRTFMAIAISLLAVRFSYQKKYFKSLITELIAISFHNTAIIMVGAIIIMNINWNRLRLKQATVLASFMILFFPMMLGLFVWIFPVYEDTIATVPDQVQGKNIILQIVFIFSIAYGLHILKNQSLSDQQYQEIASLVVIFIFEIVLGIIGYQKWYVQRILPYLQSYLLFMVPLLLQYKYKYKRYYVACLFIIMVGGFVYTIHFNKGNVIPYTTWVKNSWIFLR